MAYQAENQAVSIAELRIEYVEDYLQQFPAQLEDDPITFLRSKAEALWALPSDHIIYQ